MVHQGLVVYFDGPMSDDSVKSSSLLHAPGACGCMGRSFSSKNDERRFTSAAGRVMLKGVVNQGQPNCSQIE
jgi:hypothetical protein